MKNISLMQLNKEVQYILRWNSNYFAFLFVALNSFNTFWYRGWTTPQPGQKKTYEVLKIKSSPTMRRSIFLIANYLASNGQLKHLLLCWEGQFWKTERTGLLKPGIPGVEAVEAMRLGAWEKEIGDWISEAPVKEVVLPWLGPGVYMWICISPADFLWLETAYGL